MPNAPKTKHRSVRIDDPDWADLATQAPGGDRSAVIKDLVRWYLRRPDAELPKRPFAPLPPDFEPINTLEQERPVSSEEQHG